MIPGPIHKGTIVIGSSLNALIYAYANDFSLVYTRARPSHPFDYFSPKININAKLGTKLLNEFFCTPAGNVSIGINKSDLWTIISSIMGITSRVLMPVECSSVKIEEGNILKALTRNARMATFTYDNLVVFDSHSVLGLPDVPPAKRRIRIFDWMNIQTMNRNKKVDYIETEDDFVNKIFFYYNRRTIINRHDLVVASIMDPEDLLEFDGTDTGILFKTVETLVNNGFPGKLIKYYPNGKPHIRRPRLKPTRRDYYHVDTGDNILVDNIEFRYDTEESLIESVGEDFWEKKTGSSSILKLFNAPPERIRNKKVDNQFTSCRDYPNCWTGSGL